MRKPIEYLESIEYHNAVQEIGAFEDTALIYHFKDEDEFLSYLEKEIQKDVEDADVEPYAGESGSYETEKLMTIGSTDVNVDYRVDTTCVSSGSWGYYDEADYSAEYESETLMLRVTTYYSEDV